jgi:hypothetical protein
MATAPAIEWIVDMGPAAYGDSVNHNRRGFSALAGVDVKVPARSATLLFHHPTLLISCPQTQYARNVLPNPYIANEVVSMCAFFVTSLGRMADRANGPRRHADVWLMASSVCRCRSVLHMRRPPVRLAVAMKYSLARPGAKQAGFSTAPIFLGCVFF